MNAQYDEGRVARANGDVDLDADTLTLYALDSSYVFDPTHDAGDLTTPLDSEALTTLAITADGYVTSDPVVFSGLAVAEDTAFLVLEDTTAGVLLAYYDTLSDDTPINIIGDGTDVTINPPVAGWLRG